MSQLLFILDKQYPIILDAGTSEIHADKWYLRALIRLIAQISSLKIRGNVPRNSGDKTVCNLNNLHSANGSR